MGAVAADLNRPFLAAVLGYRAHVTKSGKTGNPLFNCGASALEAAGESHAYRCSLGHSAGLRTRPKRILA